MTEQELNKFKVDLEKYSDQLKEIYIKKIEKVLYTQNEQSIKLQINSGIFDNTLIEFIDDICVFPYNVSIFNFSEIGSFKLKLNISTKLGSNKPLLNFI